MNQTDTDKKLLGYRSPLCVRPGDTVDFMVHSEEAEGYEADLVRILHGELNHKGGPGLVLEELPSPFAGSHTGQKQDIAIGSFLQIDLCNPPPVTELTFAVAVFPTLYLERDQALAEFSGPTGESLICLRLGERGRLDLEVGHQRQALDLPIPLHRWSFIGFSLQDNRMSLFQHPQSVGAGDGAERYRESRSWALESVAPLSLATLTLAARYHSDARPRETWNGRMDSPRLIARALSAPDAEALIRKENPSSAASDLLGFWDFSLDLDGQSARDIGPNACDGRLYHLPLRAVRGFRWTGTERDWRHAPLEYGAIHFHDDDVYDMAWPTAFSYTVPEDLRSGAYAARLRRGEETEYLTFFVSPPRTAARKRPSIALVFPTLTYLAYANERVYYTAPQILTNVVPPVFPEAQFHEYRRAFGLSTYESHSDGSGIHFSSWLRPLWNMRPNSRAWGLPADTNILYWLENRDFEYDLLTDHDIQEAGAELLNEYQVVITGSHPEYLTSEIFDAYEGFLAQGGRLMYLGGNGFYWRVAMSEHWPATLELRRAEDGTRGWASEPGEYHHAFDGGMGGLWRRQERSPNRLVGTGFCAQGFMYAKPYQRTEASRDPRADFVFKNISGDVLGAFGRRRYGVAGEEVDRFDVALGSPPHALVLATSNEFEPDMMLTKEELLMNVAQHNQAVPRADLVFFETPAGGAVFSASSMSWSACLDHQNYENEITQMSENVLNRFVDPTPFEMPPVEEPEIPSSPSDRQDGARITA